MLPYSTGKLNRPPSLPPYFPPNFALPAPFLSAPPRLRSTERAVPMCRQMALRSKCFCHQISLTNPKHFLNSALDHPRYCSTLLALSEYVVVGAVTGWFWEADRDQSGADKVRSPGYQRQLSQQTGWVVLKVGFTERRERA